MIADLKPYPAYKDSGVEWLGDVPKRWEIRRLGTSVEGCINGIWGNDPNGSEDLPCVRVADFDRVRLRVRLAKPTLRAIAPGERNRRLLKKGDLLLEKSGGGDLQPVGVVMLYDHDAEAVCSNFIARMPVSARCDSSYLMYLHSHLYAIRLNVRSIKQTTGIQNLDSSSYLGEPVSFPPLPEQAAIVRFLDHANRRIRRYIRAKQKLITLLEEQKQAIIHQAVTGQVDVRTGQPYPAYKPSGVEWLGDVPEHWDVRTFTRSSVEGADYRGATPTKTESGVFLVTAKNIRSGWIDYEASREFVAEDEYTRIMRRGFPRRGDLLLTTEAPLGHAALVDREDIALAQRVIRFRLTPRTLLSEFALFSVLDPYFQNQLLCRGTGSTALGIKASKLPQLKILCPPVDKQQAILAQIAQACDPINSDRALAARQIELLREYHTCLIADVVTGKLDVREEAGRLPDEDEEPEPLDETDTLINGKEEPSGGLAAPTGETAV